ncbi:porin [Sphingomonas sp.]|uniref:OprO/OprP family phosphate-selective porin n=1 Tax=Sphingomonas sp. TaxID=28214 RepID=UPI00286C09B0|nr:porin [Sphingomonas sp.]
MIRKTVLAALLGGSALMFSTTASAQEPPAAAQEPTEPDQSDATADAAIAAATPTDDAEAKIELLQAQVEALQEALEGVKTQMAKATPTWKGGPQLEDKDAGFSFKPKGFMQFDAGYVGFPNGERRGTLGGLNFANLGFNTRARRIVFGAEGTLPGGFGYKAEFNFAQGTVDYEDIILTYDFKKSPLQVSIGNFYPYSSLETMTSSRLGSMLERASFTDAFNYNRRLGIGVQLSDKKADSYILQAGLFSQPINDTNFNRTGWQASIRGVYSPMLGSTRLHLGANFQHRENARESLAQQYRSRPLTQITDQRFVDTGNLAAKSDNAIGLEFAAIHKSLHVAAEAQKLWTKGTFTPAQITAFNLVSNTNDTIPTGAVGLNGNPSFTGGYFELGYYLTGETRGYKGGKWDRTKVLKPFQDGGWGAIQINGRVDYTDLSDDVDSASSSVAAPFYVNGGKQLGFQASVIWNPMDYLRFMAQFGHVDVTGGPRAAAVDPTSTLPVNKRKYGVDTAAIRAQLEF